MQTTKKANPVGVVIELLFISFSLYAAFRCSELIGMLLFDVEKYPESVPNRSVSEFLLVLTILYAGAQAAVLTLPSLFPRPWSPAEKWRRFAPLGLVCACLLLLWGMMSAGLVEIASMR